jgi:hypothetical protein
MRTAAIGIGIVAVLLSSSCAYRPFVGPWVPLDDQGQAMEVFDDGSVVFRRDRLEVTLRPLTDEELNRQFAEASADGHKSTNAYTYGDLTFSGPDSTKARFTVFQVSVKNYSFPKVRVDPAKAVIEAANGREYYSLSVSQMENYYRAYARGYAGNDYMRHRERIDLLRQTMLNDGAVFSGQETDGFLVFPVLHPDVHSLRLILHEVVLRVDYRGEPIETTDIAYAFDRQIGKAYADGERVVTYTPAGR